MCPFGQKQQNLPIHAKTSTKLDHGKCRQSMRQYIGLAYNFTRKSKKYASPLYLDSWQNLERCPPSGRSHELPKCVVLDELLESTYERSIDTRLDAATIRGTKTTPVPSSFFQSPTAASRFPRNVCLTRTRYGCSSVFLRITTRGDECHTCRWGCIPEMQDRPEHLSSTHQTLTRLHPHRGQTKMKK